VGECGSGGLRGVRWAGGESDSKRGEGRRRRWWGGEKLSGYNYANIRIFTPQNTCVQPPSPPVYTLAYTMHADVFHMLLSVSRCTHT